MAHTPIPLPDLNSPAAGLAGVPAARLRARVLFHIGLAGITAFYLVVVLYRLSDVPLIDPDEPRYAAAGRTFAREGSLARPSSLLVPVFNGKPRINKPPLFYWLVAASDTLAGAATELSARAPSVAAGLATLLITVFLGRRLFGGRVGLLAGLILASTPLFMSLSRACITDMSLAAFMTATLALLMLALLERAPPRCATWLAGFCLGLALLAKATPALAVVLVLVLDRALSLPSAERPRAVRSLTWLLIAAALLSTAAAHFEGTLVDTVCQPLSQLCAAAVLGLLLFMAWRAPRGALARMPWGWALGVALLLGLWWYGSLLRIFGWQELFELLKTETLDRMAGVMHRENMFYFLYILLAVAFPWSLGLAGAIGAAWPSRRAADAETPARRADRFLLAWFLGILLFFSIPGAKLSTYILPAMPAFALLTARFLVRTAQDKPDVAPFWRRLPPAFAGLAAALLAGAALCQGSLPREVHEFAALAPAPLPTVAIQFALAIAGAWLLAWLGRAVAATLILACSTAVVILILLPAASARFLEPRSARQLCSEILPEVAACQRIASVGAETESLSYYLDRTVIESRRRRVVERRAGSTAPPEPGRPAVTENEPYDAVIKEEMARPESVVLFVQKRYYARALGITNEDFAAMSRADVMRSVPPCARFLGANRDLVVITNKR